MLINFIISNYTAFLLDISAELPNYIWSMLAGKWKSEQLSEMVYKEITLNKLGIELKVALVLVGTKRKGLTIVKIQE